MKHKIFRNDTITPQKTQDPVDDRIPNLENFKRFFFISSKTLNIPKFFANRKRPHNTVRLIN